MSKTKPNAAERRPRRHTKRAKQLPALRVAPDLYERLVSIATAEGISIQHAADLVMRKAFGLSPYPPSVP